MTTAASDRAALIALDWGTTSLRAYRFGGQGGILEIKLFPAEQLGPAVLKAWRAVLRPPIALVPVGDFIAAWQRAQAAA